MNIQVFDSIDFRGKGIFGDDGSQNMFIYQSTLDPLELKKGH